MADAFVVGSASVRIETKSAATLSLGGKVLNVRPQVVTGHVGI